MSNNITGLNSNLEYAAAVLRRLTDSYATDPLPGDIARLSGPMLEVVLAVVGEGREKNARKMRLQAECTARGIDPLLQAVASADPSCDLSRIQRPAGAGWKAFDLADVMREEIPPISWLVKPYLARPGVTAWFGKPKSMKSLLVLDMCLHVANGLSWLPVPPKGAGVEVNKARVVWLDLENGSREIKRRMRAIATALNVGREPRQVLTYSMPNPWPDLSKENDVSDLIARLQEIDDVGLLVVDHLGQVLGAVDENSPLVTQVMGNLRKIAETCNLAIVLIHHAKKGQGKDSGTLEDMLRGHGAILANVDAAFMVERDRTERNKLKITPVAVRGPDAPNLGAEFSFEQDENLELSSARFWRQSWRDDTAIAKDALLQSLSHGPKNYTELVGAAKKSSGLSDSKIRYAIADLESTGDISYDPGPKGAKIYRVSGSEASYEEEFC